jgi:hypothetical protein
LKQLVVALAVGAMALSIVDQAAAKRIRGTARADRIDAVNGVRDLVSCGEGRDFAVVEEQDVVRGDCELVTRRVSSDPFKTAGSQHATEVEPDTFAHGSTIVSAFQVGRFVDGFADSVGFATSRNAGRTWTRGILPSLTFASTPPGPAARSTDPSVAYDPAHRIWLVAALNFFQTAASISVSRSTDGLHWGAPVTVAIRGGAEVNLDKEWIACSRSDGACYISYSDVSALRMATQTSRDGGLTWSPPVSSPDQAGKRGILGGFAPGPQPLVQASGAVVIPFYEGPELAVVRSTDGGTTFTPETPIATAPYFGVKGLRSTPMPSAEIDAAGTAYLVWSTCRFRTVCNRDDLALSRSTDGVSWSTPSRIPLAFGRDYVIPGLAVDPTRTGRLGLVYYAVTPVRTMNVGFVSSKDGGRHWSRPLRLNATSMPFAWIAQADGRMVGDYISASFVGKSVVPVFALASKPRGQSFREAMFATRLPRP